MLLAQLFEQVGAVRLAPFLADPEEQQLFVNEVPNALADSFKFNVEKNKVQINTCQTVQSTGLRGSPSGGLPGPKLFTPVWGYSDIRDGKCTWPGRTFEVKTNELLQVEWINGLYEPLLTGAGAYSGRSVLDTSIHWAFNSHGCNKDSTNPEGTYCGGEEAIATDGIPIVTHLHGGHSMFEWDGTPDQFFTPGLTIRGPRFVSNIYTYPNEQSAGTLWYHDHALGITRLNVYAGLAGFYFVRDDQDTGKESNPLSLPAGKHELAFAFQDRMFKDNGELFYPAFPEDPIYDDFIPDTGVTPPSILAEVFGDFMLVNGMIWPMFKTEPREYRLRLLNGCNSRFLVVKFMQVELTEVDPAGGTPLDFWVIGSDQGLASQAVETDILVFGPGARYDVVINFAPAAGKRVIIQNLGYDAPFGGDYGDCSANPGDCFQARKTDRIMAFDVARSASPPSVSKFDYKKINFGYTVTENVNRTRHLSLFEGTDSFGRLMPYMGEIQTDVYPNIGLFGPMTGSFSYSNINSENMCLGDVEEWFIYNPTADVHPIHLHLVKFEVVSRHNIIWHNPSSEDHVEEERPSDPHGTYLLAQPVVTHDGSVAEGYTLENPMYENTPIGPLPGYIDNGQRDMVSALPDTVTRVKMIFDRPGQYVWHCHIVSFTQTNHRCGFLYNYLTFFALMLIHESLNTKITI